MAKLDGRPYAPGGAAEMDELMDLFAIWESQREHRGAGAGAGTETWD